MSGDSKFKVIFVLGAPGAGKGTQCEKMQTNYGFVHLSAGDLLRKERNTEGSEYGELISNHIKDGTIVPVQITCSLLKKEMEASGKENFLIDGFPRNKDNLDGWNEVMSGVSEVKNVLFFNCSDEACVERCLKRGLTSNRTDDNKESLQKRLVTYRSSTMPIIDIFRESNLVSEIDGSVAPDEVFDEVKKVLDRLGFKHL